MPDSNKIWITLEKSHLIQLRAKRIQKGYSLVLDINYKNKRIYEFLSIYLTTVDKKKYTPEDKNNLRIAEIIKAKRITEISNGTYGQKSQVIPDDSINTWFHHLVEVKKAEKSKSYHKWKASYEIFNTYFKKGITFAEIEPHHLEKFQNYLLKTLGKSNSAHTYMSVISSMFNIAIRDGIIENNPISKIKRIKWHDPVLKFLTLEDIKILHNSACDWPDIKKAFLFSCFTGLRISDIENLTWSQIIKENKQLLIQITQQKTQEQVRIHLGEHAISYMPARGKASEKVFGLLNRRHTQQHLLDWLKGVEEFTKIGVTFHSARHTFATLTLTYGADLKTVSELLGHSTIRVTEKYAKVVDKLKQEAINNLPVFSE